VRRRLAFALWLAGCGLIAGSLEVGWVYAWDDPRSTWGTLAFMVAGAVVSLVGVHLMARESRRRRTTPDSRLLRAQRPRG
jgi:hypothetical protein